MCKRFTIKNKKRAKLNFARFLMHFLSDTNVRLACIFRQTQASHQCTFFIRHKHPTNITQFLFVGKSLRGRQFALFRQRKCFLCKLWCARNQQKRSHIKKKCDEIDFYIDFVSPPVLHVSSLQQLLVYFRFCYPLIFCNFFHCFFFVESLIYIFFH